MNRKHGFRAALTFLAFVLLLGFALPGGAETAYNRDGYWKLTGIDMEYSPKLVTEGGVQIESAFGDGNADIAFSREEPAGAFKYKTRYTWDIPKERYEAGEAFDINLNALLWDYEFESATDMKIDEQYIAMSLIGTEEEEFLTNPGRSDGKFWAGVSMDKDFNVLTDSDSIKVSGVFPRGSKGEQLWLSVYVGDSGFVDYTYEFTDLTDSAATGTESSDSTAARGDSHDTAAAVGGGYWELVSVETQANPDDEKRPDFTDTNTVSQNMMTKKSKHPGENWEVSCYWTDPHERYAPGDEIHVDISINIDKYVWNGYWNHMVNEMFVENSWPILGFADSQGNHRVHVAGIGGEITRGSDTLPVVGYAWPKPQGENDYKQFVRINAPYIGTVTYHYEWRDTGKTEEEPQESSVLEGGYWELASVELEPYENSTRRVYDIGRGRASSRTASHENAKNDGIWNVSYYWTEPRERYAAGEQVDMDISVVVDESHSWRVVRMSETIIAGWLPHKPFLDSKGESTAYVEGVGESQVTRSSDMLHVSGNFPEEPLPGNRQTWYICVSCSGQQKAWYNYVWRD